MCLSSGTQKTHYGYEMSISLSELVILIELAANAKGEIRDAVKKEVRGNLVQLVKLVNLCAEEKSKSLISHKQRDAHIFRFMR